MKRIHRLASGKNRIGIFMCVCVWGFVSGFTPTAALCPSYLMLRSVPCDRPILSDSSCNSRNPSIRLRWLKWQNTHFHTQETDAHLHALTPPSTYVNVNGTHTETCVEAFNTDGATHRDHYTPKDNICLFYLMKFLLSLHLPSFFLFSLLSATLSSLSPCSSFLTPFLPASLPLCLSPFLLPCFVLLLFHPASSPVPQSVLPSFLPLFCSSLLCSLLELLQSFYPVSLLSFSYTL